VDKRVFALLIALGGCGVLDPSAPPARFVGPAPGLSGAPKPDRPNGVAVAPPFPGYALAWSDEFDGAALDETRWSYKEGPWRDAVNARDAIVVANGILSLVTFSAPDGTIHAPHISTLGKFATTYGYFEARVRFLESAGEWCSFFLYDDQIGNPVGNPGAAGVEMDVYEHRDADNGGWNVRDLVQVGINWDGFGSDWKRDNELIAHPLGEPLSHEWHTYAALWTPGGTTFYIDEIPVYATSKAVSHRPEEIYLTCEVRSGSWAGYIPAGGYGSLASSTTRVEVDSVRVWQPVP
jgi:beta-glucanase (GH16 family)